MGQAALFWGIAGWCGSVPLSVLVAYILRHHKRPPIPDPEPWRAAYLLPRVIGAVAGIAGGYLAWRFAGNVDVTPALSIGTGLAAFVTAFLVTDLYGFAVAGRAAGANS
jgi:hypothetical protein